MPFRGDIGKEVTRGTICVDHWNVSVTLMCADSIPVGEASPLFVEIKWRRVQDASLEPGRPEDAMPVVLSFRKQTSAGNGDIHFNSADGPTLRGFSTDICQLLWIYGQAQTAGAAPDVLLEVKIEDELRGSLPLMVKPVERQITIRAEDPAKPAPVIPPAEEALKLKRGVALPSGKSRPSATRPSTASSNRRSVPVSGKRSRRGQASPAALPSGAG